MCYPLDLLTFFLSNSSDVVTGFGRMGAARPFALSADRGQVIDLFSLYVLFSQLEVPWELAPWSFHKLYVHMPVNKTKFQRNSSLEYYDT